MATATVPSRSRRNPWEVASLDLHSVNEVLRQIQLAVDGLQVTEHKHTGTEKADDSSTTDEVLQVVESAITPPTLKAAAHNYNPAGLTTATVIRISATTPLNITGLAAQPNGTIKKFFNVGTIDITLKDDHTGSRRVNRFDLTSDIVLGADQTITIQYQIVENRARWKVIGNAGGSSVGVIDHGTLSGLTDDDHTQYVLVTNLEADRATIVTNWDDLTDGGATTLHSHAGAGTHAILSATHTDSVANAVSRGSLIYGNSTPAWDELTIGANGTVLSSDGTDVSWQTGAGTTTPGGANEFINAPDTQQPWEELIEDETMRILAADENGNAAFLRSLQVVTVGDDLVGELQAVTDGSSALIYA